MAGIFLSSSSGTMSKHLSLRFLLKSLQMLKTLLHARCIVLDILLVCTH